MKQVMALILLLGVGGTRVEAQRVASSFDQLSVLVKPGDKVSVVDLAGSKTEGRIGMLSRDKLTLATAAGPREFGETDLAQISQRRSDSLQNGAIIGAAAGAGYGLALLALAASTNDGGPIPVGVVTGMAVFTGIGAAAGAGIDALITRRQVIYRNPPGENRFSVSPLFGRGRHGVAVTLRLGGGPRSTSPTSPALQITRSLHPRSPHLHISTSPDVESHLRVSNTTSGSARYSM